MTHSHNGWNRQSVLLTIATATLFVVGLVWFLRPSSVTLSPDTYDIAIALYRVCNQEDPKGLDQIDGRLAELENTSTAADPSIVRLRNIVETANEGDWDTAMRDARRTLQEQVQRAG
ncbi:MAG: hypothetical protein AAGI63_00375 [Planctomycetota bacterium]